MKGRDCQTCAYRKYLTNELSMCSHKYRQSRLAVTGVVEMKKKEFIQLCPEFSVTANPENIGLTDPQTLRAHFGGIEKLSKSKPTPAKQTKLF